MAETQPTWISCQDPTCYTPQDMRLHDARLVCAEGVVINTGTELEVTPHAEDPLCVDIAPGGAWIDADLGGACQGVYGVHNCGVTTVCADDGDPTDPRIDLVVFQVNDASLGGTRCDSELMIITGAPSPAPVAPPLPENAIPLATLTVTAAGITEVVDERVGFETCGQAASRPPVLALNQTAAGTGTFTKAAFPDAAWFHVTLIGGGGGGGGCSAQSSGTGTAAGGASGGAGIRFRVAYDEMPDTVDWTVGAGGAGGGGGGGTGGPGSPGNPGGHSLFGDWRSGAGNGGVAGAAGGTTPLTLSPTAGAMTLVEGSFGQTIDRILGHASGTGFRLNQTQLSSGAGADGPFGMGNGGPSRTSGGAGFPGVGHGAGGSGSAVVGAQPGELGGAGAAGLLRIEAWF